MNPIHHLPHLRNYTGRNNKELFVWHLHIQLLTLRQDRTLVLYLSRTVFGKSQENMWFIFIDYSVNYVVSERSEVMTKCQLEVS